MNNTSVQVIEDSPKSTTEEWEYTLPLEEKDNQVTPPHTDEEEDKVVQSPESPLSNRSPPLPEAVAPKKRHTSWKLQQAPTKRQMQEAKLQQQQDTAPSKKKMMATTHWIAQWSKDNITPTEINCLLGKSSLVISEQEDRIYISTAKNWGHNSKLGKAIRSREHKCTQIACIQCLLEYITTGPNRSTLKQILTERDKKVAMCVAHSLGLDPKQNYLHSAHTERRNNLLPNEGSKRAAIPRRLDFSSSIASEDLPENTQHNEQQLDQRTIRDHEPGGEQSAVCQQGGLNNNSRRAQLIRENQELVLHLCKNKAFDEGEATRILCNTPEGIAVQFNRNFGERLATALRIAKTLVFQESFKQRIERAKQYDLHQDPTAADAKTLEDGITDSIRKKRNKSL